jgi:hypothetical protein
MRSYMGWRRNYSRRVSRGYVRGYPWSMLIMALWIGALAAHSFRNVLPGIAFAAGTFAFGAWYWRRSGSGRRKFGLTRLLSDADRRDGQTVAWVPSTEEALQSEFDLLVGQPGRIVLGRTQDKPHDVGGVEVQWYRPARVVPALRVPDQDLEVITEGEYAQRAGRMDRGKPPVG